jgi:hypothetical protein
MPLWGVSVEAGEVFDASKVRIADSAGLYTATNVEDALAEVRAIAGTGGGGGGGTAEVIVSDTMPSPLVPDTVWVDSSDLTTYLIYDDGISVQPVQIASPYVSAGALSGIDGGDASSTYGGTYPIDGGSA